MPRIADETVNSNEYWGDMYEHGKFPTLDHNQQAKFTAMAEHVLGTSVLDVGCGECGFASKIDLDAIEYTGIDYGMPKPRNEIPEAMREKITLIHGDALELDWPEADTVTLIDFVEHFDKPMLVVNKAAQAARKRIIICLPRHLLFTKHQNRDEHFWDFSNDEVRIMFEWIGKLEGPFYASCICDYWLVTKP